MSEIEQELVDLGKTLETRFQMHLNTGAGHTYGYSIHEKATGRRIGSKSKFSPKARKGKPEPKVTAVFTLTGNDAEFSDAESFLKAYRQKLRDEEFEAADPAKNGICKRTCRRTIRISSESGKITECVPLASLIAI